MSQVENFQAGVAAATQGPEGKVSLNRFPVHDASGDLYDWETHSQGQQLVHVDVWHGSGRRFTQFDNRYCGSGEGESHGRGHYLTPSCRGAEKYAKYDARANGTATPLLYRCRVALDPGRVMNFDPSYGGALLLPDSPVRRRMDSAQLARFAANPNEALLALKEAYGPVGARDRMNRVWGIRAIHAWVDGQVPTFVVLDGADITIREVWEWQRVDANLWSWEQVAGDLPALHAQEASQATSESAKAAPRVPSSRV
ncbi:hypothetical protein AB3X91_37880 [Paraburkholderia sp. BR14263]|uniref:hypothetical protein n=1 Tax=unclassified Paraburkholderia TaxID=2615204 RepID=UPI0034CDEB25